VCAALEDDVHPVFGAGRAHHRRPHGARDLDGGSADSSGSLEVDPDTCETHIPTEFSANSAKKTVIFFNVIQRLSNMRELLYFILKCTFPHRLKYSDLLHEFLTPPTNQPTNQPYAILARTRTK
jgi:hypothetical protein